MSQLNGLILCTGNSARSQMGEGLLRSLTGDRFGVHSAGLEPKGVRPLAIRAMDEIGIDIRGQRSKRADEYLGRPTVRYLITVCDNAEKRCSSAWPGMWERLHWVIDDPAAAGHEGLEEDQLQAFRAARDESQLQFRTWLESKPRGLGLDDI